MAEISVTIISLNEEKNIERAILSAKKISRDIVVVDSYSTDKTKEICLLHGVNFIEKDWLGYGAQKNFAAQLCKNNWIFSLDADEEISDNLAKEINQLLLADEDIIFATKRLNNFCGKWIRFGLWGRDKVHRFYNKNFVQWDNNPVHENLIFSPDTKVQILSEKLLHYSFHSEEELKSRAKKYATLSAQKMKEEGVKSNFVKLYLNPAYKFFVNYFIRLGFIDGKEGFVIARHISYETFLKYKLLKTLQTNQPINENRT